MVLYSKDSEGDQEPLGHLALSKDIFDYHMYLADVTDATKYPTKHQIAPTTKGDPTHSGNAA